MLLAARGPSMGTEGQAHTGPPASQTGPQPAGPQTDSLPAARPAISLTCCQPNSTSAPEPTSKSPTLGASFTSLPTSGPLLGRRGQGGKGLWGGCCRGGASGRRGPLRWSRQSPDKCEAAHGPLPGSDAPRPTSVPAWWPLGRLYSLPELPGVNAHTPSRSPSSGPGPAGSQASNQYL